MVRQEFGLHGQLQSLEQLSELLGFKTADQLALKIYATNEDTGQSLPSGTKIHLWHANNRGVLASVPGGKYDNGPQLGLPTLKAELERQGRVSTAAIVNKHRFGRSYQVENGAGVEFTAPIPAHYNIGTDPQGRPMTRAMHYHLSIELPHGYRFSPSSDVDQNGVFQTQLYFKDDPFAAEDQSRFGPSSGFAESRVIPDNGIVNVKVKLA